MTVSSSRKIGWALMGLSLAANIGLLVALVVVPRPQSALPASAPASTIAAAAPVRVAAMWHSFESDNPEVLVGQLRAAGFPDDIVRTVMDVLVEDGKRLERLVGPEPGPTAAESRQRILLRRQYGHLSPEKMARIERIVSDYDALFATSGNQMTFKERVHLETAKQADIAQLLTPAERFEHDLRSSATAQRLRRHLANFGTSEAEYRALFPLFREWERQSPSDPIDVLGQSAAHSYPMAGGFYLAGAQPSAALLAKIEQLLGPERFAEYRQATPR